MADLNSFKTSCSKQPVVTVALRLLLVCTMLSKTM
jgi:hypothetical protein